MDLLMKEIRKITKNERPAIMALYRYAYTEWTDQDEKSEELDLIIEQETLGLFEKGRLVSSLSVHEFQQSIRGVLKDCGGVAGIATYPEARRKGYVRELMQEGFKMMHEKGQPVSMLDPFKQSYYEQFGYVAANTAYIVQAPLKQLNIFDATQPNLDWTFERVRARNAKEEYLKFVCEIGPIHYHGYLIFKTFPDALWRQFTKESLIVFVKYKGQIQALSRYRIKGVQIEGETHSTMHVLDLLWRTREARDKLFFFFKQHQDQIQNIRIHAPFDTKVEHWFKDAQLKVNQARTPWMVRIIDAKNAVQNLPGAGDDTVTIELTDANCPWNNGIFSLQSEKGRLRLTKSSGHPVVTATIQALSALVYGTHPIEELEFQAELSITEEWARHALQRWFPPLPLYNVVYF